MERIKNVMQRLQELYYGRHQKSAIDIDLMLDYTRVMYADLLEWRTQFKDPPTTERAEPNTGVVTAEEQRNIPPAVEQPAGKPDTGKEPESQAASGAETEQAAGDDKDATEETVSEEPNNGAADTDLAADKAAPQQAAAPSDKSYQPIQRDEPAPRPVAGQPEEPELTRTAPEKESIETLQQDAAGISFEPPAAAEVRTEVKDELIVEEPATHPGIEEMPAPAPAEIPLPEVKPAAAPGRNATAGDLFSSPRPPRDIRSAIGINDKYLFLNELFSNHKTNYEETLDKLNHFSSLQQAEDWIGTRVAEAQKWDKGDPTVESFYGVLQKHFSER